MRDPVGRMWPTPWDFNILYLLSTTAMKYLNSTWHGPLFYKCYRNYPPMKFKPFPRIFAREFKYLYFGRMLQNQETLCYSTLLPSPLLQTASSESGIAHRPSSRCQLLLAKSCGSSGVGMVHLFLDQTQYVPGWAIQWLKTQLRVSIL